MDSRRINEKFLQQFAQKLGKDQNDSIVQSLAQICVDKTRNKVIQFMDNVLSEDVSEKNVNKILEEVCKGGINIIQGVEVLSEDEVEILVDKLIKYFQHIQENCITECMELNKLLENNSKCSQIIYEIYYMEHLVQNGTQKSSLLRKLKQLNKSVTIIVGRIRSLCMAVKADQGKHTLPKIQGLCRSETDFKKYSSESPVHTKTPNDLASMNDVCMVCLEKPDHFYAILDKCRHTPCLRCAEKLFVGNIEESKKM